MEQNLNSENKNWFDKSYKFLFIVPVVLFLIALVYLFMFYSSQGSLFLKDVSLSGGTIITINGAIVTPEIEEKIKSQIQDISTRKLSDLRTGEQIAYIIESSEKPESIRPELESLLGIKLTADNSSIEFTGPNLSSNFLRQLMTALLVAFILMSIVIFFMFRTFIPSIAVIFAAFADIVFSLACVNLLGIKLSAAGIAAFLMLIGYSVDTDILLTTRAIKKTEGRVNQRIFGAFKTGIFMTLTALFAVLPAFFLITGLPDSFKQIFLILAIGLFADIFNTWLTNAGIIKWYCDKKGIQ